MELLAKIDEEYDLIAEYLLPRYFEDFVRQLREKGVEII